MKQRTCCYTDLTNWEIEQYLKENDIIIIPVGNCENHAGMPVDVEYRMAEGYARLIAEQVKGLFLPNVVYFNPGGTQSGRGTIHMSMTESFRYTKELAYSLLNQGFRRQVWIPSHVPTSLFLMAMITEFFDETKVPMLYLDTGTYFANKKLIPSPWEMLGKQMYTKSGKCVNPMEDSIFACYQMAGKLDVVPAKGEVEFPKPQEKKENTIFPLPDWFKETCMILGQCATEGAPAPVYYNDPDEHVGPPVANYTREEMERKAEIGEEYMRELVEAAEFDVLMEALRKLQEFTRTTVVPKHYEHLPKNRYSPFPF